jgi:mRNA deadenylase 3'-5' endonuclease subunit Ccr4
MLAVCAHTVEAAPADAPLCDARAASNTRIANARELGQVRLMSYNILADLYCGLDKPDNEPYFPYCERQFLRYDYRYPLLMYELPLYDADLIQLQVC